MSELHTVTATFTQDYWSPTNNLRWHATQAGEAPVLEQMWINRLGGAQEWRPLPLNVDGVGNGQ